MIHRITWKNYPTPVHFMAQTIYKTSIGASMMSRLLKFKLWADTLYINSDFNINANHCAGPAAGSATHMCFLATHVECAQYHVWGNIQTEGK